MLLPIVKNTSYKRNTYPLHARTSKFAASSVKRSLSTLLESTTLNLRSVSLENAASTSSPVSWYEITAAIAASEVATESGSTTLSESISTFVLSVCLIFLDKIVK